jgi:probable HAF family extracellular repeat protein
MKAQRLTCVIAITLFIVLAIPLRLAAQKHEEEKKQNHRYRLVDISTFGGPESFINGSVNGGPDISKRGTVVGGAATSIPSPPTSVECGGLDGTVPFVFHAFKWQDGEPTDLAALPPALNNCSNAESINARGEIVGTSENGLIDPVTGTTQFRAVLWEHGEVQDLGTFGGTQSSAFRINDRGQATGFALNSVADPFTPTGTQIRAFLWENGHMEDLGTLGGPDAFAVFVNERGQVAGWSFIDSTPNATTGFPTQDLFLWEKGKMHDLGNLGGNISGPNALNNQGEVIGISNLAGDQVADPFLWNGEQLIDLFTNTSGGNPLTANAINDAGEVVGTAAFPNQRLPHAYLWKNGVARNLGTVNGDCFSEAFAINSRSQIVGQSFSCVTQTGRTFLWDNGIMIDLNTFVPPGSRLQLVDAQAINDRGEIAGDLVPPDCGGGIVPTQGNDAQCGHAFVLVPCDEDHADKKGCDFDSVDMSAAVEVRAASAAQAPTEAASQSKLSPDEMVARYRSSIAKHHRRLGTLSRK